MGLLDWIIGWFFFLRNSDVAVVHSSQGRFFFFYPNSDVAVVHSSQGRFFFFCYVTFSKMVIFGQKGLFLDQIF